MSDERPDYIGEDGKHVQAAVFIEGWAGWEKLFDDLQEALGCDREQAWWVVATGYINAVNQNIVALANGYNAQATAIREANAVKREEMALYRQEIEENRKRNDEILRMQREAMEYMRRGWRDGDGEAPWKKDD